VKEKNWSESNHEPEPEPEDATGKRHAKNRKNYQDDEADVKAKYDNDWGGPEDLYHAE